MRCLPFFLLSLVVVACTDQDPVAPDMSPLFSASAGMNKEAIIGTIGDAEFVGNLRLLVAAYYFF